MAIIVKSKNKPPFMTMPVKYQGKKIRVQHGGGFWSGVWNGVKKGYDWVKDNHVVSTITAAAGQPIPAAVGRILGFGKKKGPTKQVAGRKTKSKSNNAPGVAVLRFS